jgi:hypothetical protein
LHYREGFIVDKAGIATPHRFYIGKTKIAKSAEKRPRSSSIGKVLGTLYTQFEERKNVDILDGVIKADYVNNLKAFWGDYESRLSPTVKEHLKELFQYIDVERWNIRAHGDLKNDSKTTIDDSKNTDVNNFCFIKDSAIPIMNTKTVVNRLLSPSSRKSKETGKLFSFCFNLHRNFPHKDMLTCQEFIELLYKYGKDPVQ